MATAGLLVVGKKTPLPLRDVSVEGEVKGYVMGLCSTLKYVNDSPDPVEVVFRFPLEQSHAVVALTALIDGREIRAQLCEKEEARAAYDDALTSGRSAALGEERSGDVFSISLGNLPPQKEAEIRLQLVGELPIDAEGSIRFSLPTSLKPRYTPAGSSDPLAPIAGGDGGQVVQVGAPGVQRFCLRVQEASEITEVTSPTHTITVSPGDAELVVRLSDVSPLSKDLVILIRPKEPHRPKAVVESPCPTREENSFMSSSVVMLNFFPEFESKEAACEFIFLVDRSASMLRGSFIRSAREALILFLKSLPENSHFNIIGFGSRYESLFDRSVRYSHKSLDKATKHAERMEADLGGTELLPPLKHIFAQKAPKRHVLRQVFVLTDGSVSNTEMCIQEVRKNVTNARCFTFGIGSEASSALVEGLAKAGNGTAEFVEEGERLQPKVIRSLKRALQPAVTDVKITFKVPSGYEALQCPVNLPPVFSGEKLVAYGIIKVKPAAEPRRETCKAILGGVIQGKAFEHKIPFVLANSAVQPALGPVHHLSGKALISDWLLEGKGVEGKEEVVKVSIESGVICKFTAFVAVDGESSEPIAGAMKTWDLLPTFIDMDSPLQPTTAAAMGLFVGSTNDPITCATLDSSLLISAPNYLNCSARAARPAMTKGVEEIPRPRGLPRSPPLKTIPRCSQAVLSSASGPKLPVTRPPEDASALISLQKADGSWRLSSQLAGLLSKPESVLEAGCPTKCRGEVAVMWATVLVLTMLRSKYSEQQEEWELIAMKAEGWLRRQKLLPGVTLQDFYTAAQAVLN